MRVVGTEALALTFSRRISAVNSLFGSWVTNPSSLRCPILNAPG